MNTKNPKIILKNNQNNNSDYNTNIYLVSVFYMRESNNSITIWKENRKAHATYGREYMLGSFFEQLLTAILDPKDSKAIRIKTDPKYYRDPIFSGRQSNNNTNWKSHRI